MAKSTPQQSSKKKTLREKAEKQKKAAVKAVLQNPFKTVWPIVPLEKQQEVLENLERLLQPLQESYQKPGKKRKNDAGEPMVVDPEVEKIGSEFVLGVNSVTRRLEKDKLSLVLVCKSADPPVIVKHLAELSSVRCCPAMLINGLDTLLCSKLKIRSAVAIGFKKRPNGWFQEFISTINAPEINFPYLNDHVAKFIIDTKGTNNMSEQLSDEDTPPDTAHGHTSSFSQNQTPGSVPAQKKKPRKKKEKPGAENPFKANDNFISIGSVSNDNNIQGLDLNLRHPKTKDSIFDEVFAMRIVDNLNSEGGSVQREDVHPAEISLLKKATLGRNEKIRTSRCAPGVKRKVDSLTGVEVSDEKPEFRVSEIRRIKGNVDKKKTKGKGGKAAVKEGEGAEGEVVDEKPVPKVKEKSHLIKTKKKKSQLDKIRKQLKRVNTLQV